MGNLRMQQGRLEEAVAYHERASERDLSEQVMALRDSAAWLAAEGGDELARMLLRLRLSAVYYLNELAGSAAGDRGR
jgi:hypothetical protein